MLLIKNALLEKKRVDILINKNLIEKISSNISEDTNQIIEANSMAVLPTFFNSHTHAAMTLLRGCADDMLLKEWLETKIWPLEAKLTEEDVYIGTRLAGLEMIKSGTTFFNDMYWHYKGAVRAVREMGIRAVLSSVFIDLMDETKTKEQIRSNEKLFEEYQRYCNRIGFCLGPHTIYTVSKKGLKWAKNFSEKNNLFIHIHISETEQEVKDCIKKHNKRPIEYLESIGFLSPRVIAVHCVWLSEQEIRLLAKHNVKVVHCPVSNMKLAVGGILNYKRLKQSGIPVLFGTDGPSSNNCLDMFQTMKFASLIQKHRECDPRLLSAEEVIKIATQDSAKIFSINSGEIKQGKLADLMLIDTKRPEFTPGYNPLSDIVYSANGCCVDTVICDGKVLMKNRYVEGEEQIIKEAKAYAKKISSIYLTP